MNSKTASAPEALVETHIIGTKTREWIIRENECPGLAIHQITHVGVAYASVPYQMVRTKLSGTYMLAAFEGQGKILLDGRWQICKAGSACLAPPHVLHAFHAMKGSAWGFCWVRYNQPPEQKPLISSSSPVLARFHAEPLKHSILGLYAEVHGNCVPAVIQQWVEIIQGYVDNFAQPWHVDNRLSKLWDDVADNPGRPWDLGTLAKNCHCSGEHLRRMCRSQLGRSPVQHVIFLRMRRAASLLAKTEEKIETIAREVGYENPFVFSNTFKKWIGWRPSEYRHQHINRYESVTSSESRMSA
ncbi:MAG: Transcriptional regulator, AraC family [Verrucomicrobiales bacterium]|nr:Transcriptional regulator, AraC family [Verrucomicrobiales bacterium]